MNIFLLQANLPLLQRELLQCAQMAKQTPQSYLQEHETLLNERNAAPLDYEDTLVSVEVNENGKRKAPPESLRLEERMFVCNPFFEREH